MVSAPASEDPLHLPTDAPAWVCSTGVVVIGTGAAGLSAALELAAAGVPAALLTRHEVTTTATAWAQGGLATVWDEADSVASHIHDTLVAGAGVCDVAAVRTVVQEAPAAIRRLIDLGARFDRTPDGDYDLHLEGGHSARRILHARGDSSGAEVERTLARALKGVLSRARGGAGTVDLHTHTRVLDLLTDSAGHACGVRVVDAAGQIGEWRARAVVLATGGIGQAWSLTSNPEIATGDGLALAHRAGARLRDTEFMQFHPTVLHRRVGTPRIGDRDVLISEAVRGEGAVLRDTRGRRVMAGAHPREDLAPRDVVAATMFAHMQATGVDHVVLDATHLGESGWRTTFPGIHAMLTQRGIDPAVEPIPVRPGAHYHCGGIATDLDGCTSIPGFFAVGEVAATGLHGANRLASNSLTEALVIGHRAGAAAARLAGAGQAPGTPVPHAPAAWVDPGALDSLRTVMDHHVGVLRDHQGLTRAHQVLTAMGRDPHPPPGQHLHAALDMTSLHTVATIVTGAAIRRTESRGCHRRSDFPATSPDPAGSSPLTRLPAPERPAHV